MNQELPTTLAISEDVEIQNSNFFKLEFWATNSKSLEIAKNQKFDELRFCLADLPHSLGRITLIELPAQQKNYLSKTHCILNYQSAEGQSQQNKEEEKKIQKDIQHSDTKPMDRLSVPLLQKRKSKQPSDQKSQLSGIKEELQNSKSESIDDLELFATAQEQVDDLRDLFFTKAVSWRKKYRITIQDMSMNGTFVNDERIGKGNKVVLKSGDKICLVKPKNSEGILGFFYYEFTD